MSVATIGVGSRKEPILGYVPKNDDYKNSGGKGLKVSRQHYEFNRLKRQWIAKRAG